MFPIGDDDTGRRTLPLVTYALIAVNALFFLVELSGGERVQIPRRSVENGTAYVDYVTEHLRDEPRRCAELHRLLEVLEADGSLKNATELMLAPTDPRRRLLGVTWRGPVFSCCVSTGVIFRMSAEGRWLASNSGCRE